MPKCAFFNALWKIISTENVLYLLKMPKLEDERLVIYNWIWHDLHKIHLIAKRRLTILLMLLHFTCEEISERPNEICAHATDVTHTQRSTEQPTFSQNINSVVRWRTRSFVLAKQTNGWKTEWNRNHYCARNVVLWNYKEWTKKKEQLVLKADRIWVFFFTNVFLFV